MKVRLLNDDDRLGYFAWALETWSLTSPVSRLLASPAAASVDDAVHWINRAVESELYPGEELLSPYAFRRQFGESLAEAELYPGWRPLRYTEFIGIPPTFILAQGDRHFAADDSPNAPVVLQEAAYQLMLAS
jgi:hypothetical protein